MVKAVDTTALCNHDSIVLYHDGGAADPLSLGRPAGLSRLVIQAMDEFRATRGNQEPVAHSDANLLPATKCLAPPLLASFTIKAYDEAVDPND